MRISDWSSDVCSSDLFAAAGVDAAIIQRFGPPFCTLGGVEFIEQIAHERLGARAIVVGDDFSFGARRSGDMVLLRAQATHFGFAVDAVSSVRLGELRCSSTALREALALPDLAHAAELLGRPYRIVGGVRRGLQLGRTLNMPTANINLRRPPALRLGVRSEEHTSELQSLMLNSYAVFCLKTKNS